MTVSTTLTANCDRTDTVISVVTTGSQFGDFPLAQFPIAIGGERMTVIDGFGTGLWTVQRDTGSVDHGVRIVDEFDRVVSGNWGMTPEGVDWSEDTGSSNAVDSGIATLVLPTNTSFAIPRLVIPNAPIDQEFRFQFTADKVAAGGAMLVRGRVRQVGGGASTSDRYELRAKIYHTDGHFEIQFFRASAGATTAVGGAIDLTATVGAFVPGDWYDMAIRAEGVSPTTLSGKVWKDTNAEPSAYQLIQSDSTAAHQVPGSVGPTFSFDVGATNAPVQWRTRSLFVTQVAAGQFHASGSTVVLVEDWPLPITILAGSGAPVGAPVSGAAWLDVDASPPVLYIRVGAAWHTVTLSA